MTLNKRVTYFFIEISNWILTSVRLALNDRSYELTGPLLMYTFHQFENRTGHFTSGCLL